MDRRIPGLDELGDGPESSAVRPRTKHDVGGTRGSVIEEHHVFPQAHEQWFRERGIKIHEYVIDLEIDIHKAIHGGSGWRLGKQEWDSEWNARIMRELRNAEDLKGSRLTPDEIIDIGKDVMKRMGLSGDFHKYSGRVRR